MTVFTKEEQKVANKTCRRTSFQNKRVVLDEVIRMADKTYAILDYGAGVDAEQVAMLRRNGWENVVAHEFGDNWKEGVHDPRALYQKYDMVYASCVLNVQENVSMLERTLMQIAMVTKRNRGRVLVNYPNPRKVMKEDGTKLSKKEFEDVLAKYFKTVFRHPKNVFMLMGPRKVT